MSCTVDSDCHNGGSCQRSSHEPDFLQPNPTSGENNPHAIQGTCKCRKGFYGNYCQHGSEKHCTTDDDCFNGGSCRLPNGKRNEDQHDFMQPKPSSAPAPKCVCPTGFIGTKCGVRDYDIELEYPSTTGNGLEGGALAGTIFAVLAAIAVVFWFFVKSVGGTTRGLATSSNSRRPKESGEGDGIAMSDMSTLRKRRATTSSSMDAGPVLAPRNPGEVL